MRLFIAIRLSDAMRDAVRAVQEDFRRRGAQGNFTPVENLHLTLAFIGEYPAPEDALEALSAVPFAPFDLRLQGVGAFRDLWWVGLEPCEALTAYVRALRHALAEAGVPFDRKRFSPHITLARRVEGGRGVAATPPRAETRVEKVSLMRSDRGKGGMIYTEIGEVWATEA